MWLLLLIAVLLWRYRGGKLRNARRSACKWARATCGRVTRYFCMSLLITLLISALAFMWRHLLRVRWRSDATYAYEDARTLQCVVNRTAQLAAFWRHIR